MKFSTLLKMLGLTVLIVATTQKTQLFADTETDSTESFAVESAVPVENSTPDVEKEKTEETTSNQNQPAKEEDVTKWTEDTKPAESHEDAKPAEEPHDEAKKTESHEETKSEDHKDEASDNNEQPDLEQMMQELEEEKQNSEFQSSSSDKELEEELAKLME